MKYFLSIFGCQMNKSDSERIAAVLESAGWTLCLKEEDADLIIVVACSVRQSAVDRIYGRALKYEKLKKQKPNLKTILTGCVLDRDKQKLSKKFDVICEIKKISQFLNFFETVQKVPPYEGGKGGVKTGKCAKIKSLHLPVPPQRRERNDYFNRDYLSIIPKYQSSFQAYVPIMTGCNNFCAYCVVPYTRGREYSRPVEDILNEVKNLIVQGYKEIFLIGQNVNSYKGERRRVVLLSNQKKNINFPSLLRLLNSIEGDFWIRFATSHPKDMSDELIKLISKCEKICPYIHLPIQSGSNRILKKMNRKYTRAHYLELIKKIKKNVPDVMISTDVIVGFPGESENDFQQTADIFKKIKYSMAYIARYSPREGTAASKLKDDVPRAEKARREHILTEILKQTAEEHNKHFLEQTIKVLVEKKLVQSEAERLKNEYYIGKNRQFINVKFQSEKNVCGKFVDVKITKTSAWGLAGLFSAC